MTVSYRRFFVVSSRRLHAFRSVSLVGFISSIFLFLADGFVVTLSCRKCWRFFLSASWVSSSSLRVFRFTAVEGVRGPCHRPFRVLVSPVSFRRFRRFRFVGLVDFIVLTFPYSHAVVTGPSAP